jgi:hypothetical protein
MIGPEVENVFGQRRRKNVTHASRIRSRRPYTTTLSRLAARVMPV